jgi:hypothetical protein
MIKKTIFISGIIILLPCLFLSCSREESPLILPSPFSKPAYGKRAEAAFFSDSAARELRILRNEIYAHHGRMFEAKDLKDYFGRCGWYRPSRSYSDAVLSKAELEMIGDIKSCETYLQNLKAKDKQRYDSVKTFYRKNPQFDTTIVDFLDYTGDGKKEKCLTTITRKQDNVLVHYLIIAGKNDTIYNETEPASFAPDKELVPAFDVYNNLKTAVRLSPFRASLQNISPDLKKQYDGEKKSKEYVARFRGEILATVTGEGGGCCFFWYAPEKRFDTLYCE